VSITGAALESVQELAEELDVSQGEVVRRAIAVLKWVKDMDAQGADLLVRDPDGQTRIFQVIFT
jgi:hypothetical protein